MSTEIMEIDCGRVVYSSVGEIIAVMGTHAPEGCLICDGATLDISDYSALSAYFAEEFGSANYFGGDGETTFALPDLRNLFLRGYHADAASALSGGVGEKQEATNHVTVYSAANGNFGYFGYGINSTNRDTSSTATGVERFIAPGTTTYTSSATYTSRPVNMAVLYCIKYV